MTSPSNIHNSLKSSIREGVSAQVMVAIVDYFMVPYLLFLNGSVKHVALLVALPQLLSALSQVLAIKGVEVMGTRKKYLLWGVGLQAVFLIPICFLPFIHSSKKIELFILLIMIHRLLMTLIGPVWGSVVSQYLPEDKRGHFFGQRSQLMGWASLVGIALGGLSLFLWKHYSLAVGFSFIFAVAALARFVSFRYMNKLVELPLITDQKNNFTFWMFIRRFRQSNFVKFVFFVSFLTFATHIAAPFFSVFMLRDLHFTYLQYMSIHLMAVVAGFISLAVWGRHADEVGNARILKLTGYLIPFVPMLWLGSTNIFYLIVVEMIGGFLWGGFNLCALNFIYDAAVAEKRVRVLSYFNVINGLALFAGSLLGGYLVPKLPAIQGYHLYSLFLLSGCLRLIAAFVFSRFFNEVRLKTKVVGDRDLLFSVLGIKPVIGRNTEIQKL